MNWLKRIVSPRSSVLHRNAQGGGGVPKGIWSNCPKCSALLHTEELEASLFVCPKCGHHMPISARVRLQSFFDRGEMQSIGEEIKSSDPLSFEDTETYKKRLSIAQKKTGESDALLAGSGALFELPVTACAFEFGFMGGSMGSTVGERFVLAAEHSLKHKQPFVVFSASGGARMQESLFSLMQMARTSAAIAKLKEASLPFLSVMTNPTYGGVSASLALLGDLNIAEPAAMIGFAGPRVIEQTVREKLPKDFQTSEFLLDHGMIDFICDRRELRKKISDCLRLLLNEKSVDPQWKLP